MNKRLRLLAALGFGAMASGCGTTYQIPDVSEDHTRQAMAMFAEEQAGEAGAVPRVSSQAALRRYQRVVARVEPVAEAFCESEMEQVPDFDCDIAFLVDTHRPERNAYQTYEGSRPIIAMTGPMLMDARNDHEIAFVLGHEVGHVLGQHHRKQEQQALAGALILGALTAYGQSRDPYAHYTPQYNQWEIERNMELGAGIGQAAYSQTYELESDVVGTYIAKTAGYDPVIGARFFARPENPRREDGRLSFWGTHPPDEKRLATVLSAAAQLEKEQGLRRKQQ